MRSGAENQLRFRRRRMLDLSLLISALPESYKATEPHRVSTWSKGQSTRRCWRR
jgi:hypothetical protein